MRPSTFVLALASLAMSDLVAQQVPEEPRLVVDIDTRPAEPPSSAPSDFTAVGAVTYFLATTPEYGRELYRTFGTPETTRLVADIRPGLVGSSAKGLRAVGSRLFFFADDGVHGLEPYVSDGSAAGTTMIADLTPGSRGSVLPDSYVVNGKFMFLFDDGVHGIEPWVTDGTAQGTVMLADISPGVGSSISPQSGSPSALSRDTQGHEALVFAAFNGSAIELWRSDATSAGTFRLASLFAANVFITGWATMTLPNGRAILDVRSQVFGQSHSLETWSSDGTLAGTLRVAVSSALALLPNARSVARGIGDVAVLPRESALLVTDGSAGGTRAVPLGASYVLPEAVGEVSGSLWLIGRNQAVETRLLRFDPQSSSVTDVGALPILPTGQFNTLPAHTLVVGNRILSTWATSSPELWSIDPLQGSAVSLARCGGTRELVAGSNTAFFSIADASLGFELAVTDGTAAGTRLLTDIARPLGAPLTRDSSPQSYYRFGLRALFAANTVNGKDLFVSDGTAVGTRLLLSGIRDLAGAVESGDRMYMAISTEAEGSELWVTDGTMTGTRLVADLLPGPFGSVGDPMVALGERVLFVGQDSSAIGVFAVDRSGSIEHLAVAGNGSSGIRIARIGDRAILVHGFQSLGGAETFVTDGTAAGTHALGVIQLPRGSSFSFDLVAAGDRAWLLGVDPADQLQLISLDGTQSGTQVVATLAGSATSGVVRKLIGTSDLLWIVMLDRIVRVDARTSSIDQVMFPAGTIWSSSSIAAVGSRAVFVTSRSRVATQLWSSDGTAGGTGSILQMAPSDFVARVAPAGGRFALLSALSPSGSGLTQLFVTDGTAAGTRLLSPLSSNPISLGNLTGDRPGIAGGYLWLTVQHPTAGLEPHVIELGAVAVPSAAACGGAMRAASLRATSAPVLGSRMDLAGRSSAGSAAFVLLGLTPPNPMLFTAAGACEFAVDPSLALVSGALPISAGVFQFGIDVPDLALLDGLSLSAQAVIAPTDGLMHFDLSNGLQMDLGR